MVLAVEGILFFPGVAQQPSGCNEWGPKSKLETAAGKTSSKRWTAKQADFEATTSRGHLETTLGADEDPKAT